MAIKNVEELEKIFSRRLYFTVFYVECSRLEWFDTEPYYHIYMRRDLTHFVDNETIKDSNGNPMYKIPIDIEAVRRSLYDHREILRRFMHRPRTEHVSMHYLLDTLEDQAKEQIPIDQLSVFCPSFSRTCFRCSYNGNKEEDEDNNFLILHPRTLTSCTVVTHDLLIERVNYTPYSLIYLKGYVNVHFSELKALLESMISLFDFEHYSHEIDEVNTAEMREEFEELRGFQNYKSTMKEVIKKFWDNMDLKLAPSMQELEAIEVIVPEISLFPAEYL
ncbi:unnamed protein product, partial [Mesorhabditis belari]|uniref:Uncharacterized protein n=1 Tax=Mesorhabditis belari TaxID=2138241 RepID=A0AAF3F8S0_9BILA